MLRRCPARACLPFRPVVEWETSWVPTAEDWDRAYREGRHTHMWDTPWPSPELAGALAVLPNRGRAVDLGCGTGSDAILLAQRGLDVVGIDLSGTAVAMAKAKARAAMVSVDWAVGDVLDLPMQDSTVDLATDRGCLHYLEDTHRTRYAHELARVLRPGGLVLVRGMSAPERYKTAVTGPAIRAVFAPPNFGVVSSVAFTMLGANGRAPATLALVRRQ